MYLHVGNNKVIRKKEIIGIFDLDTATISSVTRKYLNEADKTGIIETVQEEIPKSFIVTNTKIYITQLSAAALHGRTQILEGIDSI